MNADDFWRRQVEKNQMGKPKYTVSTEPDTPEQELMRAWMDKWHKDFAYFDNAGCGCCINIYQFDAPHEAIAEIPPHSLVPYAEK